MLQFQLQKQAYPTYDLILHSLCRQPEVTLMG